MKNNKDIMSKAKIRAIIIVTIMLLLVAYTASIVLYLKVGIQSWFEANSIAFILLAMVFGAIGVVTLLETFFSADNKYNRIWSLEKKVASQAEELQAKDSLIANQLERIQEDETEKVNYRQMLADRDYTIQLLTNENGQLKNTLYLTPITSSREFTFPIDCSHGSHSETTSEQSTSSDVSESGT